MFQVEPYPLQPNPQRIRTHFVDRQRGLAFRWVGTGVRNSIRAFVLTWGHRQIPVETQDRALLDPLTDSTSLHVRITQIGDTPLALRLEGTRRYSFEDAAERREALALAAEAILFYVVARGGPAIQPGSHRVVAGWRQWRAVDFSLGS